MLTFSTDPLVMMGVIFLPSFWNSPLPFFLDTDVQVPPTHPCAKHGQVHTHFRDLQILDPPSMVMALGRLSNLCL